jgi:hypothetical protein
MLALHIPLVLGAIVPGIGAPGIGETLIQPTSQEEQEPAVRQALPSPEEIAKLPADGGPAVNRMVVEKCP